MTEAQRIKVLTDAARGCEKADLIIRNAKIINVLSGEIREGPDVAVSNEIIVGIGEGYEGKTVIDASGLYLAPGFIDGHIHLESSMIRPVEFARICVPRGTSMVITDAHEISNVLGRLGVEFILEEAERMPMDIRVMLPSCVPATPMETAGAELGHDELKEMMSKKGVIGLGEMMNFPGVIFGDAEVLEKLAVFKGKIIDGHAPGLSGKDLCAYLAAGIDSDHECTTEEEAREKLELGMYIALRQGSTAKNLSSLSGAVKGMASRRAFLCCDDVSAYDLIHKGHMNATLSDAVKAGINPIVALQMATINTAERFGIRFTGAIACGWAANMVLLDNLEQFNAIKVIYKGRLVAENGELKEELHYNDTGPTSTVRINWEKAADIRVPAEGKRIRLIGVIPDQIITSSLIEEVKPKEGYVESDPSSDILKICVFERHKMTGNVGRGFIRGFGLERGAIASTVSHDSHNIVAIGVSDEDILFAVRRIERMEGGQVVCAEGKVLSELPLPIAGLMSDMKAKDVADRSAELIRAAASIGCELKEPFMAMSFMALPVIPELKITDMGLFDVSDFRHVSLFL